VAQVWSWVGRAILRRGRAVAAVVLPLSLVVTAVGASAIAIDLRGLELTPLTTVRGLLAIAIATELSVLMLARFLEERALGASPKGAVAPAAAPASIPPLPEGRGPVDGGADDAPVQLAHLSEGAPT